MGDKIKALVVGGGSIGARHLGNLSRLGIDSLALVEPDPRRREEVCDGAILGFDELKPAFLWGPDIIIIATPSHLHVEQALKAAQRGIHLFIEKPLSHIEDGLVELSREIESQKLVSLVGCNMRFHPGPAMVKKLLDQGAVGRVLFARIHTGSYLPDWRPSQDYRKSYSANSSMGGGCILDCIHEIDLAQWYLGDVESVFCTAGHMSSLDINVEDVASLICKHSSGPTSEIHLDYVQRTYERGCQIVGEQGTIFWDYNQGEVRWFDALEDSWTRFTGPKRWDPNQMYLDELEHFLECVSHGRQTVLPVSDAIKVMNIVFAAKASAGSGCIELVEGVHS